MKYVYYIGRNLEEYDPKGTKWSLEGIYSSKEKAFENVDNNEFIVKIELDKKLPKEIIDIEEYWWKINNTIIYKDGNK